MSEDAMPSSPAKGFDTIIHQQPAVRNCQVIAEWVNDHDDTEESVHLELEITIEVRLLIVYHSHCLK